MQFLESIDANIDQPNQHPILLNGDNAQSRRNFILSTIKLIDDQHHSREKKRKYLDARLFIRHHTNLSKIRKKFPGGKSIRGNP